MREEEIRASMLIAHTFKHSLDVAKITLSDALCCSQDFCSLPDILHEHIGRHLHLDWLAAYLIIRDEDVANIFTNNGVAFNWHELYPQVMAYDRCAPLVMGGKPGDIFLSQEMVDLKNEKDRYVYEFITHHTGARHSLNMPLAKEDGNSLILSLYRNEQRKIFHPLEVSFIKKLSPLLQSFASLILLHRECHCNKLMLEDLIQKENLYTMLIDPHAQLVNLPDHTRVLLKEWFGSTTGWHLPAPLEEWIKGVVSPAARKKEAYGPWAMNCHLPAGTLSCSAHMVHDSQKRPLCLIVLKPQHRDNDFSILEQAWLTKQEIKVITYLPYGYTNHQIAQALGCREGTVKKHLQSVGEKLHALGKTEILYQAMRQRDDLIRHSA